MSTPDASKQDSVLISSVATMFAYDKRSIELKNEFLDRRKQVISVTFAATAFGVLSGLLVSALGDDLLSQVVLVAVLVISALTVGDLLNIVLTSLPQTEFTKNVTTNQFTGLVNFLVILIALIVAGMVIPEKRVLGIGLSIFSVVLAGIVGFLREDVIEFSKTTTWINLRYITEELRAEIFLYWMRAGHYERYQTAKANDADNELARRLTEIQEKTIQNERGLTSVFDATGQEAQLKFITAQDKEKVYITEKEPTIALQTAQDKEKTEKEPTIALQMVFDRYKKIRLDGQKAWYDGKITKDYADYRRSSRLSRGVLLAGAIVSGLGLAMRPEFSALVAITTALSVAITSYSNVNMYGKTYGLFQIATQKLGNYNREWQAQQDDPGSASKAENEAAQRKFVVKVEEILKEERDAWYELAINIQTISDGTIIATAPKSEQNQQESSTENKPPAPNGGAGGTGNTN
jgi:hypothetical protein